MPKTRQIHRRVVLRWRYRFDLAPLIRILQDGDNDEPYTSEEEGLAALPYCYTNGLV
jgi:hypothetical protein